MNGYQIGDSGVAEFTWTDIKRLRESLRKYHTGDGYVTSFELHGNKIIYRWRKHANQDTASR